MFAQIPTPQPGSIESWLFAAAAIASLVVLGKKLFLRRPPLEVEFVSKAEFRIFRETVERDLNALRDRIDARFLTLTEKMDEIKTELLSAGQRGAGSIHRRISDLEAGLARVDERTRKRGTAT